MAAFSHAAASVHKLHHFLCQHSVLSLDRFELLRWASLHFYTTYSHRSSSHTRRLINVYTS